MSDFIAPKDLKVGAIIENGKILMQTSFIYQIAKKQNFNRLYFKSTMTDLSLHF